MIRRLVEADYFRNRAQSTRQQLRFWFLELRTPELLLELASTRPEICHRLVKARPLLQLAASANETALIDALNEEEKSEREADRRYWAPLKAELERLRHSRLQTE